MIGLARQVIIFATICHKELLKLGKTCSLVFFASNAREANIYAGSQAIFLKKQMAARTGFEPVYQP